MYQTYKAMEIPDVGQVGTGWLPPLPDLRDYTDAEPEVADMAKKLGLGPAPKALLLPDAVDLRAWCSPVENQGNLGSCTAHAGVGVVEYFQTRAHLKHIEGSRLFVYKTTRTLAGLTGDSGAWLRNTMGALALCGVPPEKYWPYTDGPDFDFDPGSFVYALADNFEALRYFSHDPLGARVSGEKVLESVKRYLGAGIPSMFGFWIFSSFYACDERGCIPFPCPLDSFWGGHAVVAVGYDDKKKITNLQCNQTTVGALLIRNSWGTGWGQKGYGWLPYDYVVRRLALDFWSLLCMAWVDTKQFGI